jgi:hypothetical protein
MEQEIADLKGSWYATVMVELSRHRGFKGGANQVPLYIGALGVERARFAKKFVDLRANPDCSGQHLSSLIDTVEKDVETMYQKEIRRVVRAEHVDFDL